MSRRCRIEQNSDQDYCRTCARTWDVNDPSPGNCPIDAAHRDRDRPTATQWIWVWLFGAAAATNILLGALAIAALLVERSPDSVRDQPTSTGTSSAPAQMAEQRTQQEQQ